MIFDIASCEEKIGYSFKDKMLLRKCFTHSSYANEHREDDNELLEFFGDAVIEFVVTEYLFKKCSGDEGKLTEIRKEIVSKDPLLKSVKKLGLSEFVLLGSGQKSSATFEEKLFSSIYEAVVAGIYIDGGIKYAKKFIEDTIISDYERKQSSKKRQRINDYKSEFQEYVQKRKMGSISYETLYKKGPDHLPEFKVCAILNGKPVAEAKGSSKKMAEMKAAKSALTKLKKQGGSKN